MSELEIYQFPCLSDNYGVLVRNSEDDLTASIDAPDAMRSCGLSPAWVGR